MDISRVRVHPSSLLRSLLTITLAVSHKMKTLAVERSYNSFKLLSSSIHNWPTKLSKFKSVVTLKQMCILHPFTNRKYDFYAVTMLPTELPMFESYSGHTFNVAR